MITEHFLSFMFGHRREFGRTKSSFWPDNSTFEAVSISIRQAKLVQREVQRATGWLARQCLATSVALGAAGQHFGRNMELPGQIGEKSEPPRNRGDNNALDATAGPIYLPRMRGIVAKLSVLFLPAVLTGCLSSNRVLYPPVPIAAANQFQTVSTFSAQAQDFPAVYVVSNGWHAGLILKRDDVDLTIWPELAEIPSTEYVEIGWGNEGFYMAKQITPGLVLGALVPSPSVLHVAGFTGDVERIFRGAELVRIELSKPGLDEMCRFIHATYVRDKSGQTVRLGPGLYGESEFYRAHGKYYFPNTCNVWTANALRAAGCPITPAYASTAQNLVFQAKLFPTSQCPPFSTRNPN